MNAVERAMLRQCVQTSVRRAAALGCGIENGGSWCHCRYKGGNLFVSVDRVKMAAKILEGRRLMATEVLIARRTAAEASARAKPRSRSCNYVPMLFIVVMNLTGLPYWHAYVLHIRTLLLSNESRVAHSCFVGMQRRCTPSSVFKAAARRDRTASSSISVFTVS